MTFGVLTHNTWPDFRFNREDFDLSTGEGLSSDTQSHVLSLSPAAAQRMQIDGGVARNITSLDRFGGSVRLWDANATALYPVSEAMEGPEAPEPSAPSAPVEKVGEDE